MTSIEQKGRKSINVCAGQFNTPLLISLQKIFEMCKMVEEYNISQNTCSVTSRVIILHNRK